MKRICGSDHEKWAEAVEVTCRSLRMRQRLWDGVLAEMRCRESEARPRMEKLKLRVIEP